MYIFDKETIACPQCYKGKTFTQRNNIKPKIYNGLNIRTYHHSKDLLDEFENRRANSKNTN